MISTETARRVEALFRPVDRAEAVLLLESRCGRNLPMLEQASPSELERVQFAALKLSGGDLGELRQAVVLAETDWRDLLVAAGFQHDPAAHRSWVLPGRRA